MIRLQLKYRNSDDDYAPLDYSFVSSQAEGQRCREGQAIHRNPTDAVVRHRAVPDQGVVDAYGTHARRQAPTETGQERVRRGLPSLEDGPPPVQRVAYPEDEPTPSAAPSQEPLFDPPVAPDIPEWLRIAQQNNMPGQDRAPQSPQVTAAPAPPPQTDILGRPLRSAGPGRPMGVMPQTLSDYEEAGYPEELLQQQYAREEQARGSVAGGRRHGAQAAVRHQHAQADQAAPRARRTLSPQEPRSSYPPSREEMARQSARQAPAYQEAPRDPGGYAQDYNAPYQAGYDDFAPKGYEGLQPPMPNEAYDPYAQQAYEPSGYDPYSQGFPRPEAFPQGAPLQGYQQNPYAARRSPRTRPEAYPDNDPQEAPAKRSIPWLGIGAVAVVFVAVMLWLMQMSFTTKTGNVLREREAEAAALLNSHPYRYRELVETQSQVNNLHPAFIAAIILNESSFNPEAESSVGARGLMQMMPDTAKWVHGKIDGVSAYSFDMMYDANVNVRYACWYMNFLSKEFRGDPILVAAAFHTGQGEVRNWLNDSRYSEDSQSIVLEDMMDGPTKNYVTKVLKAYAAYKRLYYEEVGT